MDIPPASSRAIVIEELTSASSSETLSAARALLLEYGQFVVAQRGAAQFCFGSLENEAARLPASYLELHGGSLLAYVDHDPAGFVAWRALPEQSAPCAWEMKRLWVRPIARGLKLGRRLTEEVITRARATHQSAIYLDTVPESMASAYAMYLELGFEPCSPYNDNSMDGITFLRKLLR
ncbi:MAG TPA: GNAT family N-acetyltransferase [Terracidiphilus sp.]|jgi:GNAT superfamily N-acetyltransferase|nr:GNAT family N-acetyltransferase [Terracidiphilus sp.]